jgi:hypothetical protein
MNEVETVSVQCPYCWEKFDVVVDCSVEEQKYIEDCSVCCKPIDLSVTLQGGTKPSVIAHHESE